MSIKFWNLNFLSNAASKQLFAAKGCGKEEKHLQYSYYKEYFIGNRVLLCKFAKGKDCIFTICVLSNLKF